MQCVAVFFFIVHWLSRIPSAAEDRDRRPDASTEIPESLSTIRLHLQAKPSNQTSRCTILTLKKHQHDSKYR